MMKIFYLVLLAALPMSSCDTDELAAEAEAAFASLNLSDCSDTSDSGYVAEDTNQSDEDSDAAALQDCIDELQSEYDIDGDGALNAEEEAELETHATERKAANCYTDEAEETNHRACMRTLSKGSCMLGQSKAYNDTPTDADLTACHKSFEEERNSSHRDNKCKKDANGECAPLAEADLKTVCEEKKKAKVGELCKEFVAGAWSSDATHQAAVTAFNTHRSDGKTDRAKRDTENQTKEKSGKDKSKERGSRKPKKAGP